MKLHILLATYNSAEFLQEQLDSILNQDYQDFSILIRDGGSTDSTLALIDRYCRKYPEKLHFLCSCRASALENFSLLLQESDADVIMFSDHDDIWKQDKISKTLQAYLELEKRYSTDTPLLVFTDSEVVNSRAQQISPSLVKFQNLDPCDHKLNHLIVQNTISGTTMLLNKALQRLIQPIPSTAVMHDHWITLTAAALGKIAFLDEATLLYRQHANNIYGAERYSLPVMLRKLLRGRTKLRKRFEQNIIQAAAFGERYAKYLSENDAEMLRALKDWQNVGFFRQRYLLWKYQIKKSGILRNIGMFLFC